MRYPRKIVQTLDRFLLQFDRANRRAIEALRDAHRGEQCVVLATGPSAREVDLSLLDGHPFVFGVNGAYKLREAFRYYFCSCANFYLPNRDAVHAVAARRLFLSSHVPYRPPFARDPRIVYVKLDERGRSIASAGRFETDLRRTLYWGPTVLLDLVLPAAVWMGFKDVVLVGADFTLRNYRHAYGEREHRTIYRAEPEPEMALAHRGFEVVRRALEAAGVRVRNCSPLSDLAVFERPPLGTVLPRRRALAPA